MLKNNSFDGMTTDTGPDVSEYIKAYLKLQMVNFFANGGTFITGSNYRALKAVKGVISDEDFRRLASLLILVKHRI